MLNTKSLISKQKGSSLYLTLIIITLLLAIALGINAILLAQLRMVKGIGDSVIAFFAADTGIERVLHQGECVSYELGNGAIYEVQILPKGVNGCNAQTYCIKSVGTFKGTKRAIEINY